MSSVESDFEDHPGDGPHGAFIVWLIPVVLLYLLLFGFWDGHVATNISVAGTPSQYFDLGMGTDGRQLGALDILTDNPGVDFGPYLQRVVQNVRENWDRIASGSSSLRLKLQSKKERMAIEFAVTKDGKVQDIRFATFPVDSEFAYLTRESVADAFPPLPNDFNGPYLRLRFRVYYNPDKSDEHSISADELTPRALYAPEPKYTELARKSNLQGSCTLGLIVEEDGHPSHIRVLKSIGMGLDESAVAAVQKWRFEPAMKDGHPVRVQIAIEVDFHLYKEAANSN